MAPAKGATRWAGGGGRGGGSLWAHARAPCFLGLWTLASSALIVLNKRLLVDDGFAFPLALTGAGQTASFAMGFLVAGSGLVRVGQPPAAGFYLTRLLPVVACSAGTLFLGNVAYLHLSVAFIQILKAATPAFTLTVCALAGLERVTPTLALAVALIVAGTGLATAVEAGGAAFSWLGLACFLASAFLEAIRVVYIQLLLGSLKYSAIEVLVYLAPPTAALLFAGAWIWERAGLVAGGLARVAARPLAYATAALMGFVVNVSTAQAIQATSSLTFKVVGCVKNMAVVGCAVLLGDRLDAWQAAGFAVSMAGFLLYSRAKLLAPARPASRRRKQA